MIDDIPTEQKLIYKKDIFSRIRIKMICFGIVMILFYANNYIINKINMRQREEKKVLLLVKVKHVIDMSKQWHKIQTPA